MGAHLGGGTPARRGGGERPPSAATTEAALRAAAASLMRRTKPNVIAAARVAASTDRAREGGCAFGRIDVFFQCDDTQPTTNSLATRLAPRARVSPLSTSARHTHAHSSLPTRAAPHPPTNMRAAPRRPPTLHPPCRPLPSTRPHAALTPDAAPTWTLDQIAGLVFGVGMLASVFAARGVDVAVAKSQRRALGLCERCGGVNEVASCAERDCPVRKGQGGR